MIHLDRDRFHAVLDTVAEASNRKRLANFPLIRVESYASIAPQANSPDGV